MVTLFDTSALVAALVGNHPQFTWADAQVEAAEERGSVAVCAHTLAEAYAVMTAHPKLRYPPARVVEVLSDLTGRWTVLPLGETDYLNAIARCRNLGLQGGAVYDTLIAQAAVHADVTGLVTLNARHFVRLGDDVQRLVIAPDT